MAIAECKVSAIEFGVDSESGKITLLGQFDLILRLLCRSPVNERRDVFWIQFQRARVRSGRFVVCLQFL
ncbi:hypothetical protein D3C81_2064970 [compost metagenome]